MAVSRAFLCLIVGVASHLHTALQQGQLQRDSLLWPAQETTELQSRFDSTWAVVRKHIKYHAPVSATLLQTFSKIEQQPELEQPAPEPSPKEEFLGVLVNAAVICAFAYVYTKYRCVPEGNYGASAAKECAGNWKHHCGSCLQEPITAFCGCCCLPVRWAETISLVKGLMTFWPALLVFTILALFSGTKMLSVVAWLSMGYIGAFYRQELRKRFNFESQGGASYVTDCLMYLCCTCCAVVQEARHVEEALARKHAETECPEGRPRSICRRHCLTQRLYTSDGPEYRED